MSNFIKAKYTKLEFYNTVAILTYWNSPRFISFRDVRYKGQDFLKNVEITTFNNSVNVFGSLLDKVEFPRDEKLSNQYMTKKVFIGSLNKWIS